MTAPANNLDTTTGGGGDIDGGANDPVFRSSTEPPPATTNDTSGLDGGTEFQGTDPDLTGDVDPGLRNPETDVQDTTGANSTSRTYFTGDVDPGTSNPQELGDTTVLGGGIGADSTGQAYVPPPVDPPASNRDTSGQSGVLSLNPGSPDSGAVGSDSGVNPNGVEPGFFNSSFTVAETRDTTNTNSKAFTPVPAQLGTPNAPTNVLVVGVPQRTAVEVSWTAPDNAEATGVVGYIIETNTLGHTEVGKNHLDVEFEQGLIPGDTYTFTVFARTSNGTGRRSAPSAPFTVPKHQNLVFDDIKDEGL